MGSNFCYIISCFVTLGKLFNLQNLVSLFVTWKYSCYLPRCVVVRIKCDMSHISSMFGTYHLVNVINNSTINNTNTYICLEISYFLYFVYLTSKVSSLVLPFYIWQRETWRGEMISSSQDFGEAEPTHEVF